jgi:hypothetical protein
MNKTITAFSIAFGIASLGVCAQASASMVDEEIVHFRVATTGEGHEFPVASMKGFSGMELVHTWSVNDSASLSLPLFHNGKRLVQVTLPNTRACISDFYTTQNIAIGMQNGLLVNYEYTTKTPTHNVVINFPKDLTGDKAVVEFNTPNSCLVDVAFPGAGDPRKLGISVNSLLAKYATEAEEHKGSTPPPPPPPPAKKIAAPKAPATKAPVSSAPADLGAPKPKAAPKVPTGSAPAVKSLADEALGHVLKKAPPKTPPAPAVTTAPLFPALKKAAPKAAPAPVEPTVPLQLLLKKSGNPLK